MILLLDVGPSMHGVLQEVKNICLTLVHKKASTCSFMHHRASSVNAIAYSFASKPSQIDSYFCSYFITGAMKSVLSSLELKVSYLYLHQLLFVPQIVLIC